MILLYNNPSDPLNLFNRFQEQLSDDCRYRLQTYFHITSPTNQQIVSLALQDIQILLEQGSKCLSDFNLPDPTMGFNDLNQTQRIIAEETDYDISELRIKYEQSYFQMNDDQRHILDKVISAIDSKLKEVAF